MLKTEERNPNSKNIDKLPSFEMIKIMQEENYNAVRAIESQLLNISKVIDKVSDKMACGGRLFYVGCGTSGRLGIVDASEAPPTYGVSNDTIIGIIAGGDGAIRTPVEKIEDNQELGILDLEKFNITALDSVIGISVAGGAKYVLGALEHAKSKNALTVALTCNENSTIGNFADLSICTDTGAEVITGSTRMKAGSAHKMVLNMISTSIMIKLGHVYENLMINLKPANIKLKDRMIRIVSDITGEDLIKSKILLDENNWVIRKAVESFKKE